MTTRTIKKNTFDAIRNELLTTDRPQSTIAADYQVSPSTVSWINNVRTWQNHLVGKKALSPLRLPLSSVKARSASVQVTHRQSGAEILDATRALAEQQKVNMQLTRRIDLLSRQISYLTHISFFGAAVAKQLRKANRDHYHSDK